MEIQLTHPNGKTYPLESDLILNCIRINLKEPYISYTHLKLKGNLVCVCLETEEEIRRKLIL